MKPLIVGEAPGKNGDASNPIEGRIGMRLATLCGISLDEFLTIFDRVNLLDSQPQDNGKGTDFNVKQAARVARVMEKLFASRPFVIILGKRAGSAFGLTSITYFEKVTLGGVDAYVVPHPSGVNRWFNDLENEVTMLRFMHKMYEAAR